VELVLDACDATSEKTEEVDEEAEEERLAAYGWFSGRRPKLGGKISRLMVEGGVLRSNASGRQDNKACCQVSKC
jgi:hypothetical protein